MWRRLSGEHSQERRDRHCDDEDDDQRPAEPQRDGARPDPGEDTPVDAVMPARVEQIGGDERGEHRDRQQAGRPLDARVSQRRLRQRDAGEPAPVDPSALRTLILLSEAQLRAEGVADVSRQEVRSWADEHARLFQTLVTERAAWQAERDAARQAITAAEAQLAAVTATLRWRFVCALMRPFDRLRR